MPFSIAKNRFLREFSTFDIGGPMAAFAEIHSEEAMIEAVAQQPVWILGKGSNCLFPDEGIDGLVLRNRIAHCIWEGATVRVGAGYSFARLGQEASQRQLSGLEFAAGVPGSIGGAIFMNAGAQGQETAHVLRSVKYLHMSGAIETFTTIPCQYRTSPFQRLHGVILEATFQLTFSTEARMRQRALLAQRKHTQPLREKSAGCIFRNPEGVSAGALIERCGLKGSSVGDAVVSPIHANFIVNRGAARARDVRELIAIVQHKAQEKTGITLICEIRIL